MALHDIIEQSALSLGLDLVDIERTPGGTLRVTVDWPWTPELPEQKWINAEDCERLTRQLVYALEVDGIDYKRLEVSSPGIDRPLRTARDFERFSGEIIDLTLKAAMGEAANGLVSGNRKKFRGTLQAADDAWQLVWTDDPPPKPGVRVSKRKVAAPLQVLGFTLDEMKEARLAPLVNFKGRGAGGAE